MANIRALPGGVRVKTSPGSVTSFTMQAPDSLVVGDCILVLAASDNDTVASAFPGMNPNDGFYRIDLNGNDGNLGGANLKLWYRFAKSVDIGKTYTLTAPTGSSQVVFMCAVEDVHYLDPLPHSPGGESADGGSNTSNSLTGPSIASEFADALAFFLYAAKGGNVAETFTLPSGMTKWGDASSPYTKAAIGTRTVGTTPSGDQVATKSGTARRWSAATVALRDGPAPALETAREVSDNNVTATYSDTNRTLATQFYVDETAYVTEIHAARPTTSVVQPNTGAIFELGNPTPLVEVAWPSVGTQTGKLVLVLPSPVRVDPGKTYFVAEHRAGSGSFLLPGLSGYFNTGGGSSGQHNGYVHMPSKAAAVNNLQGCFQIGPSIAIPDTASGSGAYYGQDVMLARAVSGVNTNLPKRRTLEQERRPSQAKSFTLTRRREIDVERKFTTTRTRVLSRRVERNRLVRFAAQKTRPLATRRRERDIPRLLGRSRTSSLVREREADRRRALSSRRTRQLVPEREADRVRRAAGSKSTTLKRVREVDRRRPLVSTRTRVLTRRTEVERVRGIGRARTRAYVRRAETARTRLLGRARTRTTPRRTTRATRRPLGRSKSRALARRGERDRPRRLVGAKSIGLARRRTVVKLATLGRSRTRTLGTRRESAARHGLLTAKTTTLRKVREVSRPRVLEKGVVLDLRQQGEWCLTEAPFYAKSTTLRRVAEVTRIGLSAARTHRLKERAERDRRRRPNYAKNVPVGQARELSGAVHVGAAKTHAVSRKSTLSRRRGLGSGKTTVLSGCSVWSLVEPLGIAKSTRLAVVASSQYPRQLTASKSFTLGHVREVMRYAAPYKGQTLEIVRQDEWELPEPLYFEKTTVFGRVREVCSEWPFGGIKGRRLRKKRTVERRRLYWDSSWSPNRITEVDKPERFRTRYRDGSLKTGSKPDGLKAGAKKGALRADVRRG